MMAPTSAAATDSTQTALETSPGQVVGAGQDLFVGTDLSTVWAIGDLYEKDFAVFRTGSTASIAVPATNQALRGRVAYIAPRVDPATRTAKIRVEVPNTSDTLRLGMFVTMAIEPRSSQRPWCRRPPCRPWVSGWWCTPRSKARKADSPSAP